ncbi:LytR/AlgR family response regulator transcription factor [Methylotenera mobilis]|uniref:Two component transcriptional regulator, LytTR family n=1 Tax=Methylotenera mobilis (strain JLW8 / ATCC BAA-1282 / DSM 17540) TaxID=583345 RepID=C6WYV3_METML|nr:LytTR family DNA-binding domain-containing protein [Methylotenera mobilis]ACT47078.1 two component transcriptional regulator, LytTR family [Methylotenera mobilis JLW8]
MLNQTNLNIVIADDEAPARSRLRTLLGDIPHTQIMAEARNGKELLEVVNQASDTHTAANIVLLDIRMPEMDGIEAAQHLQKLPQPPAIIFTTAYDNYAIQAFDISAVDYLLKPIRLERLQTALQKARALQPSQLETLTPLSPQRTHLSINERGRILLVPINEIIYLRAELKYITVRTAEREYLIEESLSHLEQEFSHIFTRLHRNCLAANAYILGYEKRHHDEHAEKQWVALLKHVPETISVSRRQQHLIRQTIL